MASSLISYCGLYCGACSFKQAFVQNDRNHLKGMPSYYDRLKEEPLDDCPGCRLENICGQCNIRDCAQEKGFDWCSQCLEFPCEKINEFAHDGKPHHEEVLKKFKKLQKLGEKEWLKKMNEKWTCSICGRKKSWYYKPCECK